MPQVVECIDRIGRIKKRDVLFLEFHKQAKDPVMKSFGFEDDFDYENCTVRKEIMLWLDKNEIPYTKCFGLAQIGSMVMLSQQYLGQLYIDIPYDSTIEKYKLLEEHLENPDGTTKIEGIKFCYLPYKVAMKYKEHDEPGFWDDF